MVHCLLLENWQHMKRGFADRIVSMAEEQSSHRRSLENKQMDAEINHFVKRDIETRLGQIFGFAIAIIGIITGLVAALKGAQVYGIIISFTTIASIVVVFVKGRDHK